MGWLDVASKAVNRQFSLDNSRGNIWGQLFAGFRGLTDDWKALQELTKTILSQPWGRDAWDIVAPDWQAYSTMTTESKFLAWLAMINKTYLEVTITKSSQAIQQKTAYM